MRLSDYRFGEQIMDKSILDSAAVGYLAAVASCLCLAMPPMAHKQSAAAPKFRGSFAYFCAAGLLAIGLGIRVFAPPAAWSEGRLIWLILVIAGDVVLLRISLAGLTGVGGGGLGRG